MHASFLFFISFNWEKSGIIFDLPKTKQEIETDNTNFFPQKYIFQLAYSLISIALTAHGCSYPNFKFQKDQNPQDRLQQCQQFDKGH